MTTPRDVFIHVSNTAREIEGLGRTPVQKIQKIELLEWKATGTSTNPNASGVYANEVVWLKCVFNDSAGGRLLPTQIPQRQTTQPDQQWKLMLNVEKPHVVLQDNSTTPVLSTELSGNLRANPTLIALNPAADGGLNQMSFSLHTNPTNDTQITYANLYLWLRVHTM